MDIKVTWQNREGKWCELSTTAINFLPRDHFLALFKDSKLAVVAKQENQYITNRTELYDRYKMANSPVMLFSDCQPSDKPLVDVGFI